jgi:hypothetical protein
MFSSASTCSFITLLLSTLPQAAAFVPTVSFHGRLFSSSRSRTAMVHSSAAALHDDSFYDHQSGISSVDLRRQAATTGNININDVEDTTSSRFLQGDQLQELRAKVLKLNQELQDARLLQQHADEHDLDRVDQLARAILEAQQVDAEYVYTVAREQEALAERNGQYHLAATYQQQAQAARQALPQFQLQGLWVGKFANGLFELINVTYTEDDELVAYPITATSEASSSISSNIIFSVPLSPSESRPLPPIQLQGESVAAAAEWGSPRFLPRFSGQGRVSASENSPTRQRPTATSWVDGQMILVSEQYFSFYWLGSNEQVFFGRPSPELTLKLMRQRHPTDAVRAHLSRCWDETEHMQDDLDVEGYNTVGASSSSAQDYYAHEGCFE